jgi:hypothetical protein
MATEWKVGKGKKGTVNGESTDEDRTESEEVG